MESGFAELQGVKSIPLTGLNERIVPESIAIGDLSKLIGLRQNKLGELVRYPGEERIDLLPLSSIRGLFFLGDYLIIQTSQSLLRARINEIFPEFIQQSPELFPDSVDPDGPPAPAINPELMSYALVSYQEAAGVDGAALSAGNWPTNKVPFNTEESDSAGRVSVAAGVITISAGAYPANVRIDGEVSITGVQNDSGGANSSQRAVLRFKNNSTSAIVAVGTVMREFTANQANHGRPIMTAKIKGRFTLSAATPFVLECYAVKASTFGLATITGTDIGVPEKYAQLEILVEE